MLGFRLKCSFPSIYPYGVYNFGLFVEETIVHIKYFVNEYKEAF